MFRLTTLVSIVWSVFVLATLFVVNKGQEAYSAENAFEKRYYGEINIYQIKPLFFYIVKIFELTLN